MVRQGEEKLRQDYHLVRERAEQSEGPSPLALDLQKRLLDAEKYLIEDDDNPCAEVETILEVEIGNDEENSAMYEGDDAEDDIENEREDEVMNMGKAVENAKKTIQCQKTSRQENGVRELDSSDSGSNITKPSLTPSDFLTRDRPTVSRKCVGLS
jgi:hypothetical protein